MLSIAHRDLPSTAADVLYNLQLGIDGQASYEAQVSLASELWADRANTKDGRAAFKIARDTLSEMCVGSVRCAYCEDSLADEVEHIKPKSLFPQLTFVWRNYCFACGPCNGPKNNRYGIIDAGAVREFRRTRNGPIEPPPTGPFALIDPRSEDPTDYLELDLGGQLPDGQVLVGTFEFLARNDISDDAVRRAEFTIDVLGLNREVIRASRENAFGGFRARLSEYAHAVEGGASVDQLHGLKLDLLRTPHLTVFHEMRRQHSYLPAISALFARAPEALAWSLVST